MQQQQKLTQLEARFFFSLSYSMFLIIVNFSVYHKAIFVVIVFAISFFLGSSLSRFEIFLKSYFVLLSFCASVWRVEHVNCCFPFSSPLRHYWQKFL